MRQCSYYSVAKWSLFYEIAPFHIYKPLQTFTQDQHMQHKNQKYYLRADTQNLEICSGY